MKLSAKYDASSIEIEGTADSLRQFSKEIQDLDGSRRIELPDPVDTDSRGLRSANTITMSLKEGLVNIAVSEGGITISGSKEKLLILAQNFLFLADSEKTEGPIRDHIHIEYYPSNFPFLDENALPLIVTKQEN
jgi:hypothetical protein